MRDGGQVRQQVADEEVGGRLRPHVGVVAHLQPLRHQREQVDRAARAERLLQDGQRHLPEPDQPLDRLRSVDPEPGHLARALVDSREGPCARQGAVDDEDRRLRAEHARHGADRGVMVGRLQFHAACTHQPTGVLFREPTADALLAAVRRLDELELEPFAMHRQAQRFAPEAFRRRLAEVIDAALERREPTRPPAPATRAAV